MMQQLEQGEFEITKIMWSATLCKREQRKMRDGFSRGGVGGGASVAW